MLLALKSQADTEDEIFGINVWKNAIIYNHFITTSPYSLVTPHNKTEVKVSYNKNGLFIHFNNDQDLSDSTPRTTLKDQSIQGDFNEIIIDFDGSGARAFGFKVGRSGSTQDSVWVNENVEDTDWDGSWFFRVYDDDKGWVSEFFIPWNTVVMEEKENRKIRVYFGRWHQATSKRYAQILVEQNLQQHQSPVLRLMRNHPVLTQRCFQDHPRFG